MRFARMYPSAHYFQEVVEGLFKVVGAWQCDNCGYITSFLNYTKLSGPVPLCSEECLYTWAIEMFGPSVARVPEDD